jgi:hypothetical protein
MGIVNSIKSFASNTIDSGVKTIKKATSEVAGEVKDKTIDFTKDVFETSADICKDVSSSVCDPIKKTVRDCFDNEINMPSNIPFANAIETAGLSLLGEDKATLGDGSLELVKNDPAMKNYEEEVIAEAKKNPDFGKKPFTFTHKGGIELGGKRAEGDMFDQLKDPLNEKYQDTWKVAGNELTWMLRHASMETQVSVDAQGNISMKHHISDTLDLKPHEKGSSNPYDVVTGILDPLYHGLLQGSAMDIEGDWTSQRKATA